MPEEKVIVINTGPLIALTAATGNLDILQHLYCRHRIFHIPASAFLPNGV